MLAEFGIVIRQGIGHIAKRLPENLEDGKNALPGMMRELLQRLGDAKSFKNARQVPGLAGHGAAPRGHRGQCEDGRERQARDVYLRTLLIHGARALIAHTERKPDHADGWLRKLLARRNRHMAAVALAAKNARIAWALLAHERSYQHDRVATRKAA